MVGTVIGDMPYNTKLQMCYISAASILFCFFWGGGLCSTAVNQLVAQHLLSKLKVICKTFDSRFVKHTQTQQIAPVLALAKGQKKKKSNIKWPSLDWAILDLPLKQLGADALCQLMFRVTPVSTKASLMRPRQARCAQPSRGNVSARALVQGKKRKGRSIAGALCKALF